MFGVGLMLAASLGTALAPSANAGVCIGSPCDSHAFMCIVGKCFPSQQSGNGRHCETIADKPVCTPDPFDGPCFDPDGCIDPIADIDKFVADTANPVWVTLKKQERSASGALIAAEASASATAAEKAQLASSTAAKVAEQQAPAPPSTTVPRSPEAGLPPVAVPDPSALIPQEQAPDPSSLLPPLGSAYNGGSPPAVIVLSVETEVPSDAVAGTPGSPTPFPPFVAASDPTGPTQGPARSRGYDLREAGAPGFGDTGPLALPALLAVAVGSLLAGMIIAPVLTLYHRLAASEVLSNGRRGRVLALVRERPGITPAEVAAALGVDYRTARHHLDVLARHGHVVRREVGPRRRYFENHGRFTIEEEAAIGLLSTPENVRFLQLVAERPGIPQNSIAARLGLAKSTVSRRAAILRNAGFLCGHEGGLQLTNRGTCAARPAGAAYAARTDAA